MINLIWALQAQAGFDFLLHLILALVTFVPLPWLVYRGYALIGARYDLDRDGVRLRWGLRSEDISLQDIEWLRPAEDLTEPLPLPPLRWPGMVLGTREVDGLGPIEFLASSGRNLVLIATPRRIYVVSPADVEGFIETYRRINELGSLTPFASRSVYPSFLLMRVWSAPAARALVLGGLILGLALLVWVTLAASQLDRVSLGFTAGGQPLPPGPGESLLLLPALNGFIYLMDLLGGLYFFRRPDQKAVAYLLWTGGVVTPLLMMAAVMFISY
jgi:hypothetical protein